MRQNKIRQIGCGEADEFIAQKHAGQLSLRAARSLDAHLDACEVCRNASALMNNIESVMAANEHLDLEPAPAIQAALRQKISARISTKRSIVSDGLHRMMSVFQFRVPVYQAVFVMILFFAVFLYADRLAVPGDASNLHGNDPIHQIADSTDIIDSLNIVFPNEIGRSLEEDSVLARFRMTFM